MVSRRVGEAVEALCAAPKQGRRVWRRTTRKEREADEDDTASLSPSPTAWSAVLLLLRISRLLYRHTPKPPAPAGPTSTSPCAPPHLDLPPAPPRPWPSAAATQWMTLELVRPRTPCAVCRTSTRSPRSCATSAPPSRARRPARGRPSRLGQMAATTTQATAATSSTARPSSSSRRASTSTRTRSTGYELTVRRTPSFTLVPVRACALPELTSTSSSRSQGNSCSRPVRRRRRRARASEEQRLALVLDGRQGRQG